MAHYLNLMVENELWCVFDPTFGITMKKYFSGFKTETQSSTRKMNENLGYSSLVTGKTWGANF